MEAAMIYTDDSDVPVVTDEQLEASLKQIRVYTVLIPKAGPKFEPPSSDRTFGVKRSSGNMESETPHSAWPASCRSPVP
jgi:hypothetical protein